MPSIGLRAITDSVASNTDNTVLFTTLAFALCCFFCSTFTTLRTLLPLLPVHPLERRTTGSAVGPYGAPPQITPPKKLRLTSAQRFNVWLAIVDVGAACILVWEAAVAASNGMGFGGTQGKKISLGMWDWILWCPPLAFLGLFSGLAALAPEPGTTVWIVLMGWLSVVILVVSLCFGRLLVAIFRVRRSTSRHEVNAPWMQERHTTTQRSKGSLKFLQFHSNFSGLSTSFIGTVGRSRSNTTSTFASHVQGQNMTHDDDFSQLRDFRSPTPGSTQGLISPTYFDHDPFARATTPEPPATPRPGTTTQAGPPSSSSDQRGFSFEEVPRPSFGSYRSTTTAGLVGGPIIRHALSREIWGNTLPPGSGPSQVELSSKEARGAVIRIGGHLACCLLEYALVLPFISFRLSQSSSTPPDSVSILLSLAVCQAGVILAIQCWLVEGFWFAYPTPPVLTSTSAATLESTETEVLRERCDSRASSFPRRDSFPGIPTTIPDCDDSRKGPVGRAMSMVAPHPKLQVLPTLPPAATSVTSGYTSAPKASTTSGHTRLRSLTLLKTSLASIHSQTRNRSDSNASRGSSIYSERDATNDVRPKSIPGGLDEILTRSLLATQKPAPVRVPFGFGRPGPSSLHEIPSKKRTPSPSPIATPTSVIDPVFHFNSREVPLSPSIYSTHFSQRPSSPSPTDYSIDFLSAQVLPRLVPSVKVGKSTPILGEDAPLPTRRASVGNIGVGLPPTLVSTASTRRRKKNMRNLSLPILSTTNWDEEEERKGVDGREQERWIEIQETSDVGDAEIRPVESGGSVSSREARRSSGGKWTTNHPSASTDSTTSTSTTSQTDSSVVIPYPLTSSQPATHPSAVPAPSRPISEIHSRHDESEILDYELDFADESSLEEEDEIAEQAELEQYFRMKRSVSPVASPTTPVFSPNASTPSARGRSTPSLIVPGENVVLRGSKYGKEEIEEEEVAVVQCATIRPVSRSASQSKSPPVLRLGHRPNDGSISSTHSSSSSANSITSVGFRNLMLNNSEFFRFNIFDNTVTDESTFSFFFLGWHADASSGDELSSGNERSTRSNNSGLRALAERDLNTSTGRGHDSSSASESEGGLKKGKPSKREGRKSHSSRRPSYTIPPPQVPDTVEEDIDGEDKKSGAPTPKTIRAARPPTPIASAEETRKSMEKYLPDFNGPPSTPPVPSQTTTTPETVTRRSRSRQEAGARRSKRLVTQSGDENTTPVNSGAGGAVARFFRSRSNSVGASKKGIR